VRTNRKAVQRVQRFKPLDPRQFVSHALPVVAAAAQRGKQHATRWAGKDWNGNWSNRRT